MRAFGSAALVALFFSCAGLRTATPQDLQAVGAHTYQVDRQQLFTTVKGALLTLGYQPAVEDGERGLIKTAPRVEEETISTTFHWSNVSTRSSALTVSIESKGPLEQRLVVTPRIFESTRERAPTYGEARDLCAQLIAEVGADLTH